MRKIVVCMNLSLDGVMQAPGRADEDRRGDFQHGGWAAPYGAMVEAGDTFANAGSLLFGRRTYEDFYGVWPARKDSPFTPWLTQIQKYVASRTLTEPLPWQNSTLLKGQAEEAIATLKRDRGEDILILGSGELVRSLTHADLVDEFVLLIHPVILGSGKRLFEQDGSYAQLQLVSSKATGKGVVIATYRAEETS